LAAALAKARSTETDPPFDLGEPAAPPTDVAAAGEAEAAKTQAAELEAVEAEVAGPGTAEAVAAEADAPEAKAVEAIIAAAEAGEAVPSTPPLDVWSLLLPATNDVWEASQFFNYKGKRMRYWQNWATGEKSWTMPQGRWWERYWSEAHGRPYFVNDNGTKSVWLLPDPAPRFKQLQLAESALTSLTGPG